jgi:Protein of unknown function (DUF3293)
VGRLRHGRGLDQITRRRALAEACADHLHRRPVPRSRPSAGGDPLWTHVEASVALIGIPEAAAVALGAEFKQDAIFVFTPADRRIVSCTDDRVATTGWTIERG